MVQISRSKAKSASPTHSTWLSTQSTAIITVALSGERRVGSVSRSIRKSCRWGLIRDGFHALDQPVGHAKGAPELQVIVASPPGRARAEGEAQGLIWVKNN